MATQISLVTGGASGIGLAFAEQLASRGHHLILVDKSADRLGRAAVDIRRRYGVQVDTVTADLADASDVEMVERKISDTDINLLVNNAGFCTAGMLTETSLKGQLDLISVHCIAPMRFCKAAIPRMMEHHHGRIINVCSISAFCRFPRTVGYSATKGYLWIMSECLQVELVGSGVWQRTASRRLSLHAQSYCLGVGTQMGGIGDPCAVSLCPPPLGTTGALRPVSSGRTQRVRGPTAQDTDLSGPSTHGGINIALGGGPSPRIRASNKAAAR